LQLVAEDDGKRDQVLANTKKLIEQHKVAALIGYTSGAGVEASLSYLDSQNVALIGPVTGNMGIRAQHHRFLFHTRAGYSEEMQRMIGALANTGIKRFAMAYLDDVGPANPQAMKAALTQNNLTTVVEVPMNRNADNFSEQVANLMKSTPDAVVFISNAKPIVQIVRGMRAAGYGGQFATSSFSGLGLVDDLKDAGRGLIMSQVLPKPTKTHLRLIADYQKHLKEHDAEAKPNYTSLESYVAARVLVEAMRRGEPRAHHCSARRADVVRPRRLRDQFLGHQPQRIALRRHRSGHGRRPAAVLASAPVLRCLSAPLPRRPCCAAPSDR
jgi:ABC-type branched-subunit amino acid transport system substrate-binding protein